jgi:NAD+ synthase (glutamine-hydrolysing)
MKILRVALCQINPSVGDISGNTEKIIRTIEALQKCKPDIIVFPELAVTGYPPEDLLSKPQFIDDNLEAVRLIAETVDNSIVIVGFVDRDIHLYNSAAVIHKRSVVDIYHKIHLPNYGVFDEMRYFRPGKICPVYTAGDIKFGVGICEDIWAIDSPALTQAAAGADVIININASPYHIHKHEERMAILRKRAVDNMVTVIYLNMTGGQDELVFDGHSVIVSDQGEILAEGKKFAEDTIVVDLVQCKRSLQNMPGVIQSDFEIEKINVCALLDPDPKPYLPDVLPHARSAQTLNIYHLEEEVYHALVLGVSDYVQKNDFRTVCIGLSGGIDSALVASIATDALGNENVVGIFMPSRFTSEESRIDALELARNLGIRLIKTPISQIFDSYLKTLSPEFDKVPAGIAEENIQARIRGNILMGMSNKFGWLVLTTGNKSEMSVGYATLYGDMAGGFAPIKDVYKTVVYKLCEWKNSSVKPPCIPKRILTKEPSAELRSGQKDTDSLPPYDMLDPILKKYIEGLKGSEEIVSLGFAPVIVHKVISMVDRSEYKRRQSPPGIKITPLAFGRDRRFPITNKYRSCWK